MDALLVRSIFIIEHATHINIKFFFCRFFFLCFNLGGLGTTGGSGSGSVLRSILKSLSLREGVVGSEGNSGEVLESVNDKVGRGSRGDVAATEGETSEHLGLGLEGRNNGVVVDLKDLSGVLLAIIDEALNVHLVLEGTNLQLVQEGSLTSSDPVVRVDNHDGVNNVDLSLGNLGLNLQSLEERGLLRVETGGTSGDGHIRGGEGTNLGGGLTLLRIEDSLDI